MHVNFLSVICRIYVKRWRVMFTLACLHMHKMKFVCPKESVNPMHFSLAISVKTGF